jgi:cytochrome c peroxidase
MDLAMDEAVQRLRASEYATRFRKLFGHEVEAPDAARVLATFVRTILSGDSAYDKFVAGERTALSPEAQLGLKLFRGKAGCIRCHVGGNFTDERLHRTGAGTREIDVAFKTPTLREVARRAPYMHDGSIAKLDEVIDFYDKGPKKDVTVDSEMEPLNLSTVEKRALLAFLNSLNGRIQSGW